MSEKYASLTEISTAFIKELQKIGVAFLVFGGVALITSIYVNLLIGIKISILLMLYGSIVRILNNVFISIQGYLSNKKMSIHKAIILTILVNIPFILIIFIICFHINLIIDMGIGFNLYPILEILK